MIDGGFFEVSYLIIYDTKVDVCEELAGNIRNFFVFHVILNGIVHVNWVNVTQFHIVNTNTIVCQSLSVHVTNRATNLQKLLILRNGFLELAEIIEEDARTVVGSTFISGLAGALASECEYLVIF